MTPILGAIIADQYLGKYNTILIFCMVYIVGLIILTCTSIPEALSHGAGLGGFVVSIIVIGLGTGGIKSNVAPLIADQYKRRQMVIGKDDKTGEKVIIDPAITIQRIYMVRPGHAMKISKEHEANRHTDLLRLHQPRIALRTCYSLHGA